MTDIGIKFKNHELLEEAFTHRSALNENPALTQSNERLEFLGDSVLQVLSSTEIFTRFPKFPEGKLTNLRSALVRTATLALVAKKLNFGDKLLMSRGEERGGGRQNNSLLADTFEAVLGAIYLDGGLSEARKFLEINLFPLIETIQDEKNVYDFKSRLQEVTQDQKRVAQSYKTVSETDPDHDKKFTIAVFAGSKKLAEGLGKSKQEAEQEAARIALESWE